MKRPGFSVARVDVPTDVIELPDREDDDEDLRGDLEDLRGKLETLRRAHRILHLENENLRDELVEYHVDLRRRRIDDMIAGRDPGTLPGKEGEIMPPKAIATIDIRILDLEQAKELFAAAEEGLVNRDQTIAELRETLRNLDRWLKTGPQFCPICRATFRGCDDHADECPLAGIDNQT